MAKYNREFLVPYLENICALHFAEIRLDNYLNDTQYNINQMIKGTPVSKPSLPQKEPLINRKGVITCIVCLIVFFMAFSGGMTAETGIGGFFSIFVGSICFIVFFIALISLFVGAIRTRSYNIAEEERYYRESKTYAKIQEQNEKNRKQGLALNGQLQGARDEKQRVTNLLQKSYSANVIPGQYRNVYAAVYLYDYFRNSRADDLDLVLNTFVLEQIKEKLDVIIANQSEMILNQCIVMANQQKTFQQQQAYHDRMMDKLNLIQVQGEERNQYLQMIESNTAASAYFAAAEYIRSI